VREVTCILFDKKTQNSLFPLNSASCPKTSGRSVGTRRAVAPGSQMRPSDGKVEREAPDEVYWESSNKVIEKEREDGKKRRTNETRNR